MSPHIPPEAAGPAASGAIQLARAAIRRAVAALGGTDLERVFDAAGDALADTGLTASGLPVIEEDPDVLDLVGSFLETGVLDELRLVDAVESALGELHPDDEPHELAARFVASLRDYAWRAPREDRAGIVLEMRRLNAEQARRTGEPLRFDWIPRIARAAAEDFIADNPQEALQLERALRSADNVGDEIERIVRARPSWLTEGSGDLWSMLAQLAASYGRWQASSTAFVEASDRAGVDIVAMLARGAEAARAGGDDTTSNTLLNRARAVEPSHPEVILADAHELEDPSAQLALLANAEPRTPAQTAAIEATKALAWVSVGDFDQARLHVDRAAGARPDSPIVREVYPLITLIEAAGDPSGSHDYQALRHASAEFLELRDELQALGRRSESLRMQARAAETNAVAGEFRVAAQLLEDGLQFLADADEAARAHLARVAIGIDRPDLAHSFVEGMQSVDPEVELATAMAGALRDDESVRAHSLKVLDRLVEESAGLRDRAAFSRLAVSGQDPAIPWSDRAEEVLSSVNREAAMILKAQRLMHTGESDVAERLLLKSVDAPDSLELLAVVAANRSDWQKVFDLSKTLVDRAPSPQRRLMLAEAARHLQRLDVMRGAVAALHADPGTPTDVRLRALALSAEDAWNRSDWLEVIRFAAERLELAPRDDLAGWAKVQALAQLGRYAEAVRTIDDLELRPRDAREARVAAAMFDRVLPPADAVSRIATLAVALDEPDERLEALLIHAGLRSSKDDLPADLAERVRTSLLEFPHRFPDSQAIQAIRAPETQEEIEAFFREQFAERAGRLLEVHRQILAGTAPVTVAASLAGKRVVELWARMAFLPLQHRERSAHVEEVRAAKEALGRGAVLDPSALFVAGGFGLNDALVQQILGALPASVVPHSTFLDADIAAAASPLNIQEELLEVGWDPIANTPRLSVTSADEAGRLRSNIQNAYSFAQKLRLVPDRDTTNPTRFDHLLDEVHDTAFVTWPATFSVSEAWQLPIYSDDRFIRRQAREARIPTFGTLALVDALSENQLVNEADAQAAKNDLLAASTLPPTEDAPERIGPVRVSVDPTTSFIRSDEWNDVVSRTYSDVEEAHHALEEAFVVEVRRGVDVPDPERVRTIDEMVASVDVSLRPGLVRRLAKVDPYLASQYRHGPRIALTAADVRRVARLARLALHESEIATLARELTAILSALVKVSELDLTDVPPTSHPLPITNVLGTDEPRPSLPVEKALANAPDRERDFFRVPPMG